jgi:hypothetical protein
MQISISIRLEELEPNANGYFEIDVQPTDTYISFRISITAVKVTNDWIKTK